MRRVNGVLQGRQPAMDPCHGDPFPADGENVEARFVPVSGLPSMSPRFHKLPFLIMIIISGNVHFSLFRD